MRVHELIAQLEQHDPEATVEFYDVTYRRSAPVNSIEAAPPRHLVPDQAGRAILSNRLGGRR